MFKPKFVFNENYAFFIFVSFVLFLVFKISGCSFFVSFLSATFIYIFLRFTYFLYGLLLKVIGIWGGRNV